MTTDTPTTLQGSALSGVIVEIAAERHRQINGEGWSTKHDDQHTDGSLSRAAACYAAHASVFQRVRSEATLATYREAGPSVIGWPWSREWWKPKDPRRDLIRAAALIVAEIERLDRQAEGRS